MIQKNLGFTLIELIVVMALIAMAAALVVPRINASQSTLFQSDVREALTVLKYGRRMAIIQGKDSTVSLQSNSQQTERPKRLNPERWIARASSLQCQSKQNEEDEKDSKKDEEKKKDMTCNITFYPEGGSSGSEILLSFQHYRAKITLNPLTGKASWEMLEHERE
ncbi:prepilin-type N-terminal cleavage/methylation domain-containing protein [Candidatus Albibeggiatoa sp. nov. NOAA]|uniref:prepilin-type N-terminal cleavage/methylation domain-containing protein n=1 Tax=Candidatus Albibeggiatoa sp. nov. NOAA TaxID=3162724 RepID=UPI0032F93F1F|nr:prepilin-type N-terminal cleavage/methylation domain-containing protein [Thiotrichaceae bacterium]